MFHITSRHEIEAAQQVGYYQPQAFPQEGFIHCSYKSQVVSVANRLFRHREDLVLLAIEPSRLNCQVIDENLEGGTELFPHIYGSLPLTAICSIHEFPCNAHGWFQLPSAIAPSAESVHPE